MMEISGTNLMEALFFILDSAFGMPRSIRNGKWGYARQSAKRLLGR